MRRKISVVRALGGADRIAAPTIFGPLAAVLAVGFCAGCSGPEQPAGEVGDDDTIPEVSVPPADGPKLVALKHQVIVRDRPSVSGKVLGTLRAGARVARAEEPYSTRNCADGWYPIRPRGFVCAGDEATTDLEAPVAKVLAIEPDLTAPLPYRYGRVARGAAVVYGTLPSAKEQQQAEPKLRSHKARQPKQIGAGANDVPLDEAGLPTGPPVLLPEAAGVGDDGYRTTSSCFVFDSGSEIPAPLAVGVSLLGEQPGAKDTRVLKRRSGVALTQSFMVGEGKAARRFAVMPDGRFIPTDRLVPALGTTWHGVDLAKTGLPVAFALRGGVRLYELDKGKASRTDEELEQGEAVLLTGRFRTVSSVRFFFTRDGTGDGQWVRHKDIIMIPKRNRYPDFATPDQKWLDVSLANQTLVAWIGKRPLYATLISTGQDRLGDPNAGPSTIQGVFRFLGKHVTRNVDDREVGQAHSLGEVPWVMSFAEGFAITGTYWLERLGEAQSYHNIATSPIDAHWLWQWSDPPLPEGWHHVVIDDEAKNTVVYVHK